MQAVSALTYGSIEMYIRLLWLFVILITFLMLLLCYLYLSMKKAREREYINFKFSNLTIEGLEIERRRISRELHDVVLPLVRDSEVSGLLRSICMDLMPPDFTRVLLKDSLAQLCAAFSLRTGIECPCLIDEKLDFSFMSVENQLHLYRMVQESFTNIGKHSKTDRAFLVARCLTRGFSPRTENILICISDEGIGIRNKNESNEGLGIKSIRQRAAIIGAKLDFVSESGNGLMIRIEIPTEVNYES
ncbi:MAG: histidine kinase [Treponema sp.]|nr:histidine kinase [Treponema sp.]